MKIIFVPKSNYEKFCEKILNTLVENSEATFLCGGTARDILLGKKLEDFDIATNLKPKEVLRILLKMPKKIYIKFYEKFGVIKIYFNKLLSVDISTFRKEIYFKSSYPKVKFTNLPKIDSKRRDFTINSLYLKQKNGKVLDFHNGLLDLNKKNIRFIGNPNIKIQEDPFRMIRALRFAIELGFKIEKDSWLAIKKYFYKQKLGSKKKLEQEIFKLKNKKDRKLLKKIIFGKISLDKLPNKFYSK